MKTNPLSTRLEVGKGLISPSFKTLLITETRSRNISVSIASSAYQQNSACLTLNSETRQEAVHTRSMLNTRTKMRVGFWNVRTVYEIGKQAQLLREMKKNRLHVLGISTCRWTDPGKSVISTGEVIVYSGRRDIQHHELLKYE